MDIGIEAPILTVNFFPIQDLHRVHFLVPFSLLAS